MMNQKTSLVAELGNCCWPAYSCISIFVWDFQIKAEIPGRVLSYDEILYYYLYTVTFSKGVHLSS